MDVIGMVPTEIVFRGGENPKRYAIIDDATGHCVNVVTWNKDAEPDWTPGPGFTAVQDDTMEIYVEPAPIVVPERITNAQGKICLRNHGMFFQIDALAEAAGKASDLYIMWNNSPYWRRDSATLNALGEQLQLSQETIDALFIEAIQIEA